MKNDQLSALAGADIFNKIPQEDIGELVSRSALVVRSFHKDAIISFQGDDYDELMIILNGEVSAEILNPNGKKIIIETFRRSSVIASAVLFANDNTLPVTLKVTKQVELVAFSRKTVLELCRVDERFLLNYLRDAGDKVIFLAEKIRLFRFNSINQKIAGYLLNLSIKQGSDSVWMTYTREQLADLFGVARPSLSRVLSEFYDQDVLKNEGKIMHILHREELEYLLEEK